MKLKLVCASLILLAACSGNHVGLRKTAPGGLVPSLTNLDRPYTILGTAETRVSTFQLLWLANVSGPPDFERARRELTQQQKGDDVIQVSWYLEKEYWILGTVNILHIKGTVVKFDREL